MLPRASTDRLLGDVKIVHSVSQRALVLKRVGVMMEKMIRSSDNNYESLRFWMQSMIQLHRLFSRRFQRTSKLLK